MKPELPRSGPRQLAGRAQPRRQERQASALQYDWRNNWVLFVHNLDAKPREVTFSAGLEGVHIGGSAWGGLDYLLRRTDIDQPAKQSGLDRRCQNRAYPGG